MQYIDLYPYMWLDPESEQPTVRTLVLLLISSMSDCVVIWWQTSVMWCQGNNQYVMLVMVIKKANWYLITGPLCVYSACLFYDSAVSASRRPSTCLPVIHVKGREGAGEHDGGEDIPGRREKHLIMMLCIGIQSFRHTVVSSQLFLCDELTGG